MAPKKAAIPTAADHAESLAKIDQQLEEANKTLVTLESQREAIVLDGGDVSAHSMKISQAKETISSFKAARAVVAQRHNESAAIEAKSALVAEIEAAHGEHRPALEAAWRRLHRLLDDVVNCADEIRSHENEIDSANWKARRADMFDLVQPAREIRDIVAESLADPIPEYIAAKPVRSKDETDEAFNLRFANYRASIVDERRRTEPLKVAGEKAIEVIQTVAVDDPDRRAALRMRAAKRVDPARPLVGHSYD